MVKLFCSSSAWTMVVRKSWSWISLDRPWQHSSSWTFTASWSQIRQQQRSHRLFDLLFVCCTKTWSTAAVTPHLTDVSDTGRHHRVILEKMNRAVGLWISTRYLHGHFIWHHHSLPQEKRFWRQSACSRGKESLQHFPSTQLSLSADPQNLQHRVQWGDIVNHRPWVQKILSKTGSKITKR